MVYGFFLRHRTVSVGVWMDFVLRPSLSFPNFICWKRGFLFSVRNHASLAYIANAIAIYTMFAKYCLIHTLNAELRPMPHHIDGHTHTHTWRRSNRIRPAICAYGINGFNQFIEITFSPRHSNLSDFTKLKYNRPQRNNTHIVTILFPLLWK